MSVTSQKGELPSAAMCTPLVSVVVPAWNAEATIKETLDSVSGQTYVNLDIIIVDDGSTDQTVKVAEDFCSREPRARLVRKSNGGVASARNRGIREARGEWIAPIDADDLWHPSKIENQMSVALQIGDGLGFVYCWFRSINMDGTVIDSQPGWVAEGYAVSQLTYLNLVGNGSSLIAHRDALAEVGGYEESLRAGGGEGCEDLLLQISIAHRRPVALVRQYLVGYRETPGAMSSNMEQMARSWELAICLAERQALAPPKVFRWSRATHAFQQAHYYRVHGNFKEMARHLIKAVRLDPARFLLSVVSGAVRLARRRTVSGSQQVCKHFSDVDPRMSLAQTCKARPMAFLHQRLDLRRLERLAGNRKSWGDRG